MKDTYVWIDQDDRAEVMTLEQILQAAEEGRKPKHIFLTKQELALRYQLVPKNRRDELPVKETIKPVETAKAVAEEEADEKPKKRGKAVA